MTRGLTLSIVFHLALVVLAFVGLPQLVRPEPMENRLVVVDVVTVALDDASVALEELAPPEPPVAPVSSPQAPAAAITARRLKNCRLSVR